MRLLFAGYFVLDFQSFIVEVAYTCREVFASTLVSIVKLEVHFTLVNKKK